MAFFYGVKMAKRKERAKRALPESFRQKSTKSGGGKIIKGRTKPKKTGKSAMPGDGSIEAIFDYWGNKR